MIRRGGPQTWRNVHVTKQAALQDLIDIDNAAPDGTLPRGFDLLRQVAGELDTLVREARVAGQRVRALGSGWALTDIAVTDGWLINTKLLNGCMELTDQFFEPSYPVADRPMVLLAQCGMSIAELNAHLELPAPGGTARALKTAGIGAGQTVVGAVSGNTHGSAVNFGATPDWVVGLQLVTGSGRSLWLERASQPVLNDEFVNRLDATRIRDDDVFNTALVSFGAFGIIAAMAIATDPIYQLRFPPVRDISHADLKQKLITFDANDPPGLYHYEFVFDPYSTAQVAMEATGVRVPFEAGHPAPTPVWIVRNHDGFALAGSVPAVILGAPLVPPGVKTAFQFKRYRELCILGDVRATPGQLFTATITYLEGYTESALGVSINDAATMIEISSDVLQRMKIPAMAQVRTVHPSSALFSFTQLAPKTCVFEFGLVNDDSFGRFERTLLQELRAAGVATTSHWSKNSGIDPVRLEEMYGAAKVATWKEARRRVFGHDLARMRVFDNAHLERAGLGAS